MMLSSRNVSTLRARAEALSNAWYTVLHNSYTQIPPSNKPITSSPSLLAVLPSSLCRFGIRLLDPSESLVI